MPRKSPQPANPRLYRKVKEEAKRKFRVWPSMYASGWLVREYKRRGGTYIGLVNRKRSLGKWFRSDLPIRGKRRSRYRDEKMYVSNQRSRLTNDEIRRICASRRSRMRRKSRKREARRRRRSLKKKLRSKSRRKRNRSKFRFPKSDSVDLIIYTHPTKDDCPSCIGAVKYAREKGFKFKTIKGTNDPNPDHKTWPKIFHGDGKFIGGFSDLKEKY